MTSKYPHLFSPITIRNKTFKNRILVAPMGIEERGEAGILSPRGIRYYEDIAEGGCARVCTGENDVCPGTAVRGCYNFYVDEPGEGFRDSFKAYADACHRHGALAFTSFNHTGAYMRVMPKGAMPPMPAGPADAAGDGPDAGSRQVGSHPVIQTETHPPEHMNESAPEGVFAANASQQDGLTVAMFFQ